MASGEGTNFSAVLEAIDRGVLDAKVSILVVNNEGCGARERALSNGIPCIVHDHRDYGSRELLDKQLVKTFSSYCVEGIIMAGWMRVVTNIIINEYKSRIINIHPSLLPSFRGFGAIKQAIEAEVKITGCSAHFVEESVDCGDLLVQSAVPVMEKDDVDILRQRIQLEEHKILPIAIGIAGSRWRN